MSLNTENKSEDDTVELNTEINGHTDNIGSAESNLKLSQDRAISVRKALVDRGVQSERLAAFGYGEKRPIATNETDEGRADATQQTAEKDNDDGRCGEFNSGGGSN